MMSPKVTGVGLKPIVIAHPVVIAVCLLTIAGMLYWAYRTDLQDPSLWVSSSVALFVVFISEYSRRRRASRVNSH